jgi:hypothetical protein
MKIRNKERILNQVYWVRITNDLGLYAGMYVKASTKKKAKQFAKKRIIKQFKANMHTQAMEAIPPKNAYVFEVKS